MNISKSFKAIVFAILFIAINGCSKCIEGEGAIVTQVLSVASFEAIDLSGSTEVLITQGAVQEVKAIGHQNIIDKVQTSVSNSVWDIHLENACYNNYELSIEITVPNIKDINVSGSGDVTVNDFTSQTSLGLDISGSGSVTLNKFEGITSLISDISGSGEIIANEAISTLNSLALDCSGSGSFACFALETHTVDVDISGSGEAEVNVLNTLNVEISGSGSVYYKGTPAISSNISGSGSIEDAN